MLKTPLMVASIALCALLIAGCGDSKKEGGNKDTNAGGDTGGGGDGGGGAAKTADLANGAVVKGVIKFDGTPPNDKKLGIESEDFCVKHHPDGLMSEIYKVKDGKVANVIVWAKEGVSGKYAPINTSPEIDQKGCQYFPHVVGVVSGQNLVIKNSDELLHNIHGQPKKGTEFNMAQAKKGDVANVKMGGAEFFRVKCDVHGWMGAWVGVFNHPFFSVTGEDGSFEIKGLPAGKYKLQAWHEKFPAVEIEVEVKEKETKSVDFPAMKAE